MIKFFNYKFFFLDFDLSAIFNLADKQNHDFLSFKKSINDIVVYVENIIKNEMTNLNIFCSVNVVIIKK